MSISLYGPNAGLDFVYSCFFGFLHPEATATAWHAETLLVQVEYLAMIAWSTPGASMENDISNRCYKLPPILRILCVHQLKLKTIYKSKKLI